MHGIISVGRRTAAHAESLRRLGYEVALHGDKILVTVEGFLDEVDLSKGIEALAEVVRAKKALTYKTRVRFQDGAVLYGVPACTRLGPLSCLVMKPRRESGGAPSDKLEELLKLL